MKKALKIILAIILISGLAALLVRFYLTKGNFRYAGTLETTKVDISVQVPSLISAVHVEEGDRVKAGQLLIDLSCDDFKIAARFAHENYSRYSKLNKSGSATPETLDNMRTRKEDADIRLTWCTINSPLAGTVLSRYHEPGEWASPGVKVLTLSDTRDVWTYIYVPQTSVAKLSLGMVLKGLLPEMNRSFDGKIIKISEEAEFTPKNVQTREERTRLVFGVKINFRESNAEEILKPGMTLEVEIPNE